MDSAMAAQRPEKETMRTLWADKVGEAKSQLGEEPLYLTLCGAKGLDVEKLIEQGHVRRDETTAIAEGEIPKVVAVESRLKALGELQERFPGLKVVNSAFRDLVHSESLLSWPVKDHRVFCRARVVNLDLDETLAGEVKHGQLSFAQLDWVRKLAHLHALVPRLDWSLCLTLHAEITWSEEVERRVCVLLADNLGSADPFAEAAEALCGGDLIKGIADGDDLRLSRLSTADQQCLLMTLVPKRLARIAADAGFRLDTRRNLRYGGTRNRAPMVSWIFDFKEDHRSSIEPNALYRETIAAAIAECERIDSNGGLASL